MQQNHSSDSRLTDSVGTTLDSISVAQFTLPVANPICYEDGAPRLYRLKITLSSVGSAPGSTPPPAPGRSEADGPWKAERVRRGKSYSEEYQERLLHEYCRLIEKRPYICGISPWVFADFLCSWFPGNPIPFYNLKGLLSRERLPKRAFHALSQLYRQRRMAEQGESTCEASERRGSADRA